MQAHGGSQETALMHVDDAVQAWIDTAREVGGAAPRQKGKRLMLASGDLQEPRRNPLQP